ncbi:uncharacterized protein FOMMEDRAFT_139386 [Fomitiporia mediterranea MF3/22]|uniref:uncharacterized protein n=1 Tax=Fomitiporia mediterranea (strain MF3/22) TaxID=694068 RepID=UPI000440919D|nr:uncharacterized protein FOMMEDRAFT_139386 [Fomitiporia mediterranea MF3/22]EJD06134.1 hypothetical protein FOMMEDRAFT_139386 [Fomitiporia mediterranea MF3/22]
MSLYTPVFPPTDPPGARTASSSSQSSSETNKPARGLSYSSRLSQWHLAIASLPEELCPPSTPSSPVSQERSAKLQADIQQAVRQGRNISDLCKLRSTKFGYASKQPSRSLSEQGDGVPWILVDTEEEWLDWERKRTQQRCEQKGKERMAPAPPPSMQSQDAHDKVLNWKAGLQPPSSSLATAAPIPSMNSARSSLGFPVVKRSTLTNVGKMKATKPGVPIEATPRPKTGLQVQNTGEENFLLQVDTRALNAIHADTTDKTHSKSLSDLRCAYHNPPTEAKEEMFVTRKAEDVHHVNPELGDFSALPLSFPPDLMTSTQKDVFGVVRTLQSSSPVSPVDLPDWTTKDVNNKDTSIQVNNQGSQTGRQLESDAQIVPNDVAEPREQPVPQPTPPSPPYSSANSQQFEQPPGSPVIHQPPITEAPSIPTTPTRGHVRPLTPPPELIVPVSNGMQMLVQSPPRTPPPCTSRMPYENFLNVPCGELYRSVGGGSVLAKSGPTTPDAAINGAIGVGVGTDIVMGLPCTPERRRRILADPLTTSRKSRIRPRPPSRKHSVQNMDVGADNNDLATEGGANPSPAKSDRSYFSSPASGSSSGSNFSRGSMRIIPGSPTSPLGFTQNPRRFAPLAESTQVSKLPLSSQTQAQISYSQQRGPSQTQKSFGAYNSQFDVDAQVDRLSHFMRQDVDLDAWMRDVHTQHSNADADADADVETNGNTDEDEDVVAVEEMTMATPW